MSEGSAAGANGAGASIFSNVLRRLRELGRGRAFDPTAELGKLLERDVAALRRLRGKDVLRFRPEEILVVEVAGPGGSRRRMRVRVIRTVREATARGYRVRVRALAHGADGRGHARAVEVELLRAGSPRAVSE